MQHLVSRCQAPILLRLPPKWVCAHSAEVLDEEIHRLCKTEPQASSTLYTSISLVSVNACIAGICCSFFKRLLGTSSTRLTAWVPADGNRLLSQSHLSSVQAGVGQQQLNVL